MSSSLISNSNGQTQQPPNATQKLNHHPQATESASSIAVIDVNIVENNKRIGLNLNNDVYVSNNDKQHIITSQPLNNNSVSKLTTDDDGVKYKFISNETIGAKTTTFGNDFDFVNDSEASSSKFSRCAKCLKCCTVS
jgi:hypothetical protein